MSLHFDFRLRLANFVLDVRGTLPRLSVVMGPNGSGKSTFLKALVGAHRVAEGSISLGDTCVCDTTLGVDLPPEARAMAYVPQGYGLFPHMTIGDNVAFAVRSSRREYRKKRAREILARFALEGLSNRYPATLSGGEKQGVALARAMANEAKVLLLDEPFAALDAQVRPLVREALYDFLEDSRLPVVIVTHQAKDVVDWVEHLVVLEQGQVIQAGDPRQIAARPATEFVAAATACWLAPRRISVQSSPLSEDE